MKLFLFLLFIGSALQQVKSQETVYPDRIMLTIPGNPATSRAVSWRTVYKDSVSTGEITLLDVAPTLEKNKTTVTGTFAPWEKGSQTAMGHRIIFENLKPNTKYAYRVGNDKNWSEWFQFKTSSDKANPFSFLYFGDVQNDIKSYGSRILRQGYSHFPKSDFMLFAGDLVKVSNEDFWSEFFYAGGWIFVMVPSLPTPGNHEYDKQDNQPRSFSKQWNQIFTLPLNGPSEKFRNRIYFIDYQGVRFVSVAGEKMYGLNTSFWSDRMASNTQLFQNIAFSGDTLSFQSYTVAGDLYDDFKLIKNKSGINHVVLSKKVMGINQSTEIPEGEEENYNAEDMQKYRQKFQKNKRQLLY